MLILLTAGLSAGVAPAQDSGHSDSMDLAVSGSGPDHDGCLHLSHGIDASQVDAAMSGGHSDSHHQGPDCDQQCLNCTSHCFSIGLISPANPDLHHGSAFIATVSGDVNSPTYLFFRPPISA